MSKMAGFTWTSTCRTLLLLLGYLIETSLAQFDPIKDFCRRFGHQSAVVDDKLYVDGGLVNWKPYSETSANMSNQFLLYSDLKHETEGMPNVYANLSKNATIPSVSFGILWEDSINKWLYSYGGESQSTARNFILYGYDILNNYWTSFGPPSSSGSITPLSHGAGVSISERGEAFYYGGWFSENSVPGWSGTRRASDRLIKYDMDKREFSNLTGPDNVRRAEGTMVYLPISDGGMLAYFGGVRDVNGNGTMTPQPLDTIFMYDLANTRWYTQKTSGRAPEDRRLFCGGAAVAQDQSSYNIYIYGGASFGANPIGYDDIYVLSIPSFTWIRSLYPSNSNVTGPFPKAMSSCNVVNNGSQMLVIGGRAMNDTSSCDADVVMGQHNMVLGKDNPESAIWARFQPDLTTYTLPTDIVTVVGGAATGGATFKAPKTGFDAPDMSALMTRKPRLAERTPTRNVTFPTATTTTAPSRDPKSGLSTGAIAGIAVGASIAGIGLLAGLCLFCIRRRQKHYKQPRVAAVTGSNPASPMTQHQHPGIGTAPGSSWDGPGGATISSPTFSSAPTYNTAAASELPPSSNGGHGHGHGYRGVSLAPPVELPGAEAGYGYGHWEGGKPKTGTGVVGGEMPTTPAKTTAGTGNGWNATTPSDLGPGEGDDIISRGGVSPSLPSPGNGTGDSGRFGGGGGGSGGYGGGGNGGLPPYSPSGAYGGPPGGGTGGRFEEDFGHGGSYRR
ncbi:hypothetical protein B0T20DRAFT_494902 [Sordaria brevicollis]|uniref:Kelch repeat-containing protein n=1 Tax=Sordaria brevicollis TaxID=83679 RepID=A0AAE0PJ72_SORBR|nr:hypothetical protein B0T20DRAFT_494902 [Sordaria brevicollis]